MAKEHMEELTAYHQRQVLDAIDKHLRRRPDSARPPRKQLRGIRPAWEYVPPIWQLRVGEYRIFYDVDRRRRLVAIRAIRLKGRSTMEEIL